MISGTELELVKQFVPLFSPEVREFASKSGDSELALLIWWTIHGRKTFRGNLSDSEKALLFSPLPNYPKFLKFGIPPLLEWVGERDDLRQLFNITTEIGVLGLNAWFFACGIRHYELADVVDHQTIANLDGQPPAFSDKTEPIAPNWLMFFVWQGRQDLRESFDLNDSIQLSNFLAWFFVRGVSETGCASLITDRWKHWLRERVNVGSEGRAQVPRALLYRWQMGPNVLQGSDPETDAWRDDFRCPLSESEKALLFSPLPNYPRFSTFGISPFLDWISQRDDVRRSFDITTETGVLGLNAWLFSQGIREYDLADMLDQQTITNLDAHPPWFSDKTEPIAPTWLMFFIWYGRQDLKEAFDLSDPAQLSNFLAWFFVHGVSETGCASFITDRWKDWLNEYVRVRRIRRIQIPRHALFHWQLLPDVRNRFDLKTEIGAQRLIQWYSDHVAARLTFRWCVAADKPNLRNVEQDAPELPFGVNLIGSAFGELGLGEDVRMTATACKAAGVPYSVINTHGLTQGRENDQMLASEVARDGIPRYAINIFCLTGFSTVQTYLMRGNSLFANRYNIGWWPWELPVWPAEWKCAFDAVDEIWAISRFTYEMFRQATDKKVVLMPWPASVNRARQIERSKLGIPGAFTFLYVFDFNSFLERKNPEAVVAAFSRAFIADHSVCLVLKTMNVPADNPRWRALKACCEHDARIVLIEETMDRGEVLGLINACDVYVSLHRSEGFGRTLAEAMLFGKPVVATDYSGNRDFLNSDSGFPVNCTLVPVKHGQYPFIQPTDGAVWAEPDIAHAAEQMRAARAAASNRRFASQIRAFATERFSPERVGAAIRQRLTQVFPTLSK